MFPKLIAEGFSAYGISVLILWNGTHADVEKASPLGRTEYEAMWPSLLYPLKREDHFHVTISPPNAREEIWLSPPNKYYYMDEDSRRVVSFPDMEEGYKFYGCNKNCEIRDWD